MLPWGVIHGDNVVFGPENDGELGAELFDVAYGSRKVRPWAERKAQSYAVAVAYRVLFDRMMQGVDLARVDFDAQLCPSAARERERRAEKQRARLCGEVVTHDRHPFEPCADRHCAYCAHEQALEVERIGAAMRGCGRTVRYERLENKRTGEAHKRVKRAIFCKSRLCALCAWRRSRKIGCEAREVFDRILGEHSERRMAMLTLTMRTCSGDDFGGQIDQLQASFSRMCQRRAFKRAVSHWFRALETTRPEPDRYHAHYHVLMVLDPGYFDPDSKLYMTQEQWRDLWRGCLGVDYDPIVDVRVLDNVAEVTKYVTKPSDYLTATDRPGKPRKWSCDVDTLRVLDAGLRGRRLQAWSRSCSEHRRALGLAGDEVDESDLIHADDDEKLDVDEWWVVDEVVYRWQPTPVGWTYVLVAIERPGEADGDCRRCVERHPEGVHGYG
jgi:hypothetical protein